MRRTLLLLLCGVFAGALLGTHTAGQLREPHQRVPILQPADWVSFTADVEHREDDNGSKAVLRGRFMRGSDGSERYEIAGDNGRPPHIVVKNYSADRYYISSWRNVGRWTAYPMQPMEVKRRPRVWMDGMVGLSSYPHKLAILKGMDGSLAATDGLDAWIYSNRDGAMRLLVPDLNFFAVVNSSVSGRRIAYTNIGLGPVDPALFHPPPGVEVEQSQEPLLRPALPGE